MRVVITGATGFIGSALCEMLRGRGDKVVALSRNAKKARKLLGEGPIVAEWDAGSADGWAQHADGADCIINLAGENIGSGRWTKGKKDRIVCSRLAAGEAVVEAVRRARKKPKAVIQASGVGYYGPRSDEVLDESSSAGGGFLSDVARKWERSTADVSRLGVRHVVIRTGMVLGEGGGALPRLSLPFRFFMGGPLGSGMQWVSWIHLEDELKAIRLLAEREDLSGPFNLTAPTPLRDLEFCRLVGGALGRPSWLRMPGVVLRVLLGKMADELLLSGQRVYPKRLLDAGFEFAHPDAESALRDALGG